MFEIFLSPDCHAALKRVGWFQTTIPQHSPTIHSIQERLKATTAYERFARAIIPSRRFLGSKRVGSVDHLSPSLETRDPRAIRLMGLAAELSAYKTPFRPLCFSHTTLCVHLNEDLKI
jgi:hypothetical protein